MGQSAPPKVIRPLSHLDTYKSALHLLRQHCGTAVSCRYAVPNDLQGASLDAVQDVFHRALALTVLRHPLMQVGLYNEDSSHPDWIELGSIDLGKHVAWETVSSSDDYETCLRETIHSRLHTWFADLDTTPGWCVHVLRPGGDLQFLDVTFCWHHAFFDGMSAKIFHETLLQNLNEVPAQGSVPGLHKRTLKLKDTAEKFPPPPEKLRKIPITLAFTLATVWRELKPPFLVTENLADANWAPIREKPYGTESRQISLNGTSVKRLLQACRNHGTTLTGLLNALPLFSLALQLKEKNVTALSSVLALDIRRFMPTKPAEYPWHVPNQTMDNEVSLVEQEFGEELVADIRTKRDAASTDEEYMSKVKEALWSVAASTRQEIQKKLDSDMKNDLVGLMSYVKDWRVQMKSKLSKPRARSWGVTNLGVFDDTGAKAGGWAIERAVFRLSAEVNAPAFHISAVSVKGADLCVDVGWQQGILDEAIGNKLANDMERFMKYLARDTS